MSQEIDELRPCSSVGFSGIIKNGVIMHKDEQGLIFPVEQSILVGHKSPITALAASPCGELIASGGDIQKSGYASVIIWDYTTRKSRFELEQHKDKVLAVSFLSSGKYLLSIASAADGTIILWDTNTGTALTRPAHPTGFAEKLSVYNFSDTGFATTSESAIFLWSHDQNTHRLMPRKINFGSLRRIVNCICFSQDNTRLYAGTSSGDILDILVGADNYQRSVPEKKFFANGVRVILSLKGGDLLVGSGDGTVARLIMPELRLGPKIKITNIVTSICNLSQGDHVLVANSANRMYSMPSMLSEAIEIYRAPESALNGCYFPVDTGRLLITYGGKDIEVWDSLTRKVLMSSRLNAQVLSSVLSFDGRVIYVGCDDGSLRAISPESGTIKWTQTTADRDSVTALAILRNDTTIITGGKKGDIRLWDCSTKEIALIVSMKEHRGKVTKIIPIVNDEQAITASEDGSCIIWNLLTHVRLLCVFENTVIRGLSVHPDETQFITVGSNRNIIFWDALVGDQIRVLEQVAAVELTCITISPCGKYFIVGDDSGILRLFLYEEGIEIARGHVHSQGLTQICISPNEDFIASVGVDMAIVWWHIPSCLEKKSFMLK